MVLAKLQLFLDINKVKYTLLSHSPAYTAMEIAAAAHIPGKELAKTVMVKLDGKLTMTVVPSSMKVNLGRLKGAAGASEAMLADEKDFGDAFPDCELGAMPPFGNLYGMDVFVDEHLAEDEEIAFNAGSHTDLLQVAYKDFEKLVSPNVVSLA